MNFKNDTHIHIVAPKSLVMLIKDEAIKNNMSMGAYIRIICTEALSKVHGLTGDDYES